MRRVVMVLVVVALLAGAWIVRAQSTSSAACHMFVGEYGEQMATEYAVAATQWGQADRVSQTWRYLLSPPTEREYQVCVYYSTTQTPQAVDCAVLDLAAQTHPEWWSTITCN